MSFMNRVVILCFFLLVCYYILFMYNFKSIFPQKANLSNQSENRFRISFHGNISTATIQSEMPATPKATAPTPKPTIVEEKRNVIVLKEDGYIDTVKTRIDFFKDTWYDEFLQIQDALANYNNTSEESIRQNSASHVGYTTADLNEVYGILSNACITRPFSSIFVYEEKKGTIKMKAIHDLKLKDFYYNNVVSQNTKLDENDPAFRDDHTLLLHPRQYTNIFHILEGTSIILFMAIHPELFPKIDNIIISQQPKFKNDSWAIVVENLFVSVLPEKRRPTFLNDMSVKKICDRALVVAKSWEPQGTGSFIGEPLAADLFRAVVYKHIQWKFELPTDKKLKTLFIKRLTKRKIINTEEVYQGLQSTFNQTLNIKYQSLDKENALQQIELFASLDIVIGAHGAGLTNIIFMSPKSFLYELFPPFWQFACYKRLASNMDVQYLKSTAVGEKGPECNKNEKSTLCQYNGIRDRDFTMDVSTVLHIVKKAIVAVQTKKYPSISFSLVVC